MVLLRLISIAFRPGCQRLIENRGIATIASDTRGIAGAARCRVRAAVLRPSVPTVNRELWYEKQLKEGGEVVICHPKLVETGLDLLAFPTLYFYETGYSLHTLRQASGRSWRIGQKYRVHVKFLVTKGTTQTACLRLIGKKVLMALMMEGKFSGEGIHSLESDDDMMSAMARELVELAFQRAEPKEAWSLLDQAEEQLRTTDDDISLGNISSARGRIVRRTGEYAESLAYYERAVGIYQRRNADHRNLARTLVNAAYVKRLLALNLRKQLDTRGRQQPAAVSRASNNSGSVKRRYMALCHQALVNLEEAGRIYALHQHHGGTGSVLVNGGYLHLDLGDIERATVEGAKAYDLAHSKHHLILMARARILQAYAENARVEEELGEDANIATHAHQARRYAEEAVQLALQTQNRRLLAGAYIVCGMVAASEFFREWEEARRCEMESATLLRSYDRDHLGEELAILKSKIMRSIGIDETLRAWSQGVVGRKTFQQMTEEFAEVVIPQVWLREGKKVSPRGSPSLPKRCGASSAVSACGIALGVSTYS